MKRDHHLDTGLFLSSTTGDDDGAYAREILERNGPQLVAGLWFTIDPDGAIVGRSTINQARIEQHIDRIIAERERERHAIANQVATGPS